MLGANGGAKGEMEGEVNSRLTCVGQIEGWEREAGRERQRPIAKGPCACITIATASESGSSVITSPEPVAMSTRPLASAHTERTTGDSVQHASERPISSVSATRDARRLWLPTAVSERPQKRI
eukprot:6197476-Pleurochrysis_carterae.AAC.1